MPSVQPDIVVDKHHMTAVVIDVDIPRDRNIRKEEHKKLQKCQEPKQELEKMWGAGGASSYRGTWGWNPKLSGWIQKILRTTSGGGTQPLVDPDFW